MKPDIKVAALGPRCGGGDENTYNGSRAQVVNVAAEWRRLEDDPDVIRTSEISGTGLSLRHLKATNFVRGIGVRQVRLVCGLILFCYLLSHYINHSLGNVSLDAMEYGLWFHVALWHSVVGTLLLYAAPGGARLFGIVGALSTTPLSLEDCRKRAARAWAWHTRIDVRAPHWGTARCHAVRA
jgi:hypothetical protein